MSFKPVLKKRTIGMCRLTSLPAFLGVAVFILTSSIVDAADRYWNASSGNWSTPVCWGSSEPISGDWAYIQNGGTANITQTGESCTRLFLGYSAATSGTVQMAEGTLTANEVFVGQEGAGAFRQTAGTNTISNGLYLGFYPGSSGQYDLSGTGNLSAYLEDIGFSGTGTFTHTGGTNSVGYQLNLGFDPGILGTYNLSGDGKVSAQRENVGCSGIGTFTQTGGTNSITETLTLGNSSGSVGNYNLSGNGQLTAKRVSIGVFGTGTFSQSGGTNSVADTLSVASASGLTGIYNLSGSGQLSAKYEHIGDWSNAAGSFTQTGGTNTITNYISLGYAAGSTGSYNLSSTGQLSTYSAIVGDSGDGTFTQEGGINSLSYGLFLGYSSGSSGTYNLNGGTLILKVLVKGSGSAAFNFGGGTLQASGNINTALPMTLTGTEGNANIDTAGSLVTLSGVLSGTGGLNKLGSGTLTLSGTNTFTGSINFNGGMIKAASLSNLGDGSAFQFNGGGLQFGSAYDPSVRNMAFLAGGASLDTQSYNITLANPIGNGGSGGLTKQGTGILILSGVNIFSGAVNFNGGLINAASLNNLGNGSALNFNGGGLQFNGVFDPSVRTMTLQAGGATLDTLANNITLANPIGNGGIGGLTKKGSGKLILNAPNTFFGDTKISGGSITLANPNAMQSSTLDYNSYGGTLSFGTLTSAIFGGLKGNQNLSLVNTSSTAVAIQLGGNGQSTSYGGALSGTGSLTKIGSGTLTFSGTNTYSGGTTICAGVLQAKNTGALPGYSTLGKVVVNNDSMVTVNAGGSGEWTAASIGTLLSRATFNPGSELGIDTTNAIGGLFTYGTAIGGSIGIDKLGSNTLTLSALNSYNGDTTVKGGILAIAGGIAASGTSLIDIQSGKAVFKTVGVNKASIDIHTAALATFEVVNGTHTVGAISGVGITLVDSNSRLMASSIAQGTLTIGNGAKVTIRPISGGPLSGTITAVPEPSSFVILVGAFMLWAWKGKRKGIRD